MLFVVLNNSPSSNHVFLLTFMIGWLFSIISAKTLAKNINKNEHEIEIEIETSTK